MLSVIKQMQLFLYNGLHNSYSGLLDKDIGFILYMKILDTFQRLLDYWQRIIRGQVCIIFMNRRA